VSATVAVREELAHLAPGGPADAAAELAGLLRFGGALTLSGGTIGHTLETSVGAVARRARVLLDAVRTATGLQVQASVEVHRRAGVRPTRYRVVLADAAPLLTVLGLLDPAGRPVDGLPVPAGGDPAGGGPARPRRARPEAVALLRGALMAAGALGEPGAPVHMEIRAPGEQAAVELAALLARLGAPGARAAPHGDHWRVVVKAGDQVATLLARAGAHTAYLHLDGARLRRQLRGEANRAANADRANLSRAVGASTRQLRVITRALGSPGWADLPEEVRAVALARLANPEASLAELGGLLDPPVGKATVHRRLARLLPAAGGPDGGEG